MADNDPEKHHFAPRGYIKRWAGPDKKIVEFKRRDHGRVDARRSAPKGTGYRRNLYSVPGAAPGRQNDVEATYLRRVDTDASLCLDAALRPKGEIPIARRSQWARFIMRMMRGSPDKLAQLEARARTDAVEQPQRYRAEWDKVRRPQDPQNWLEAVAAMGADGFDGFGARAIPQVTNLRGVGEAIINMRWTIARMGDLPGRLLTSDKPVITSNGLGRPGAFIFLPIASDALFMATRDIETYDNFASQLQTGEMIEMINHGVTAQAYEFVYGMSEDALDFVEARLGRYDLATL